MWLLSKFPGNPTVGILRSKKESYTLRSEVYAWAPVLRSFDKLREVGVSSYLFYS